MFAVTKNKKALRRKVRELALAALPKKWAHQYIRKSLNLSIADDSSSRIKIELASSVADLKAALMLVQRNFEREGYAQKVPGALRLTPYHLLPETVVIVAKLGSQVVATISVIPRTSFGIPLDGCCQLDSFLSDKKKTVEVSALAVDAEVRGQQGAILFNLMKYMYHCNIEVLRANTEVIGVNPRMLALYEAILLFENIPQSKVVDYDFANGAPVVPMYFNLDTAVDSYSEIYRGKPAHQNVMSFFLKPIPSDFSLPKTEELDALLPQRDPEKLKTILSWNLNLLQEMDPKNRAKLVELYQAWPECQHVLREVTLVK